VGQAPTQIHREGTQASLLSGKRVSAIVGRTYGIYEYFRKYKRDLKNKQGRGGYNKEQSGLKVLKMKI
jgi:hypothetical protein